MFGVSFLEIALVGLVALIIVGPQKLPEMMRTAGEWLGKLRRMTADMRQQTGIDDILREEGIDGVSELRTLLRGERGLATRRGARSAYGGYASEAENGPPDTTVEFPIEGPDAKGALPDDLLSEDDALGHHEADAPSRSAPPPRAPTAAPRAAPRADVRKAPSPSAPKAPMSRPPRSLPPPPTESRRSPPRATTQRETPLSKSEPRLKISDRPPAPGKPPVKD